MYGFVEAPMAYWLTQGMARIAGVNLTSAVVEGWLTRPELATLVGRCQKCGLSQRCMGWMAEPQRPPLPDYCRNKGEIEALNPGV
jgi:hypothetical protein